MKKEKNIYRSEDSGFLPEEPLGEDLLADSAKSFRVWIPKSSIIVLGRAQKAESEIYVQQAKADQIPIFKRHGGGGTVFLDESSVCVAWRFPREKQLKITDYQDKSSKLISDFFQEIYALDVQTECNFDLTYKEKKFLGSSLYIPRECALYSAVLLFDNSLEQIDKYLKYPSKFPKHRQNRKHSDFLIPLSTIIADSANVFSQKLETYLFEKVEDFL